MIIEVCFRCLQPQQEYPDQVHNLKQMFTAKNNFRQTYTICHFTLTPPLYERADLNFEEEEILYVNCNVQNLKKLTTGQKLMYFLKFL